jgi:hypothetical protein
MTVVSYALSIPIHRDEGLGEQWPALAPPMAIL